MDIMCNDNRFEIIDKAKKHLLEATNIDTSPDEMKVLDNFLFRCWQMGWLDRYDEQTEPRVEAIQTSPRTECISRHYDFSDSKSFDERYGLFEPSTDCGWK